jgi:hypothetical protein
MLVMVAVDAAIAEGGGTAVVEVGNSEGVGEPMGPVLLAGAEAMLDGNGTNCFTNLAEILVAHSSKRSLSFFISTSRSLATSGSMAAAGEDTDRELALLRIGVSDTNC